MTKKIDLGIESDNSDDDDEVDPQALVFPTWKKYEKKVSAVVDKVVKYHFPEEKEDEDDTEEFEVAFSYTRTARQIFGILADAAIAVATASLQAIAETHTAVLGPIFHFLLKGVAKFFSSVVFAGFLTATKNCMMRIILGPEVTAGVQEVATSGGVCMPTLIFFLMKGKPINFVSEKTRYVACICASFLKNLVKFVRSTAKALLAKVSAHILEEVCTTISHILSSLFNFVKHLFDSFIEYLNGLFDKSITTDQADKYIDSLEVSAEKETIEFIKSTEAEAATDLLTFITRQTKNLIYYQLEKREKRMRVKLNNHLPICSSPIAPTH